MPDISPENLLYIEQTLIAMAWEISFFGAYLSPSSRSTPTQQGKSQASSQPSCSCPLGSSCTFLLYLLNTFSAHDPSQKGLRTSRARSWLFVINIIMLAISLVHIVLSMKFYIVELPTLTSDVYPDATFQQLRRWKVGLMVLRRVSVRTLFVAESVGLNQGV